MSLFLPSVITANDGRYPPLVEPFPLITMFHFPIIHYLPKTLRFIGSQVSNFEVLENGCERPRSITLFPEDRKVHSEHHEVVHVQVNGMRLERPRQWGTCWLALLLWE